MILKRHSYFLFIPILLLIPFIAMQLSDEVHWSLADFIIMGSLLLVCALAVEFVLRHFKSLKNRLLLLFLVGCIFFLVWAELAVGLFGSPFAGH
jgi:ABC-type enterobactin transport system permease subunit